MTSGQPRGRVRLTRPGTVSIITKIRPTIVLSGVCFMFGSIGMPELLIILTLALIIFGPRKLPELGRSLGKSLGEFKRASNELRNTLDEEIRIEEERSQRPAPRPAEPAAPKATASDFTDDDNPDHAVPRETGHA
jgi:sec-independent protein translocase protein TatA